MKKYILLLISSFVISDTIKIDNFDTDIFRKNGKIITFNLSLVLEGRYLKENEYKVLDSLNSIIGNFFYEQLITSKGKLTLKRTIKEYTTKMYSVDIDKVYIQKMHKSMDYKKLLKENNVSF